MFYVFKLNLNTNNLLESSISWVSTIWNWTAATDGNQDPGGGMTIMHGKLYLGVGWNPCNPLLTQTSNNPWGKILQFDLSTSSAPVIFSLGVKEPYSLTNDGTNVYGNDCGDGVYEEINTYVSGNNYGFPYMDGPICYNASDQENVLGLDGCGEPTVFTPSTMTWYRYYDGSCSAGVLYYNGNSFPCLKGRLIGSDLTKRNFSAELATRSYDPNGYTNQGSLFTGKAANIPSWMNRVSEIQVNYPPYSTMFFRLASSPDGSNEPFVTTGSIYGNPPWTVSRIVDDPSHPFCVCA